MPNSQPAIRAVNLRKRFRAAARHGSLRDLVANRFLKQSKTSTSESADRCALDGVSFDVAPGQALGVIGPNGAGKSTLLKLLAGILCPDSGEIDLRGPVAALIELSAGFHPDLSGRDNIFLNAAILGMSREKLIRRFDDILAFADIGDAIDEPVKHYSSGMQARLGFAIAAQLDAPILLIDEVLAVGDRAFRTRCLDRMRASLANGAAILFVSHDLDVVRRFCTSALVLVEGRPAFLGPTDQAVAQYHDFASASLRLSTPDGRPAAVITNPRLTDAAGRPIHTAVPGQTVVFEYDVAFNIPLASPSFGLYLMTGRDRSTIYETSSTRLGLSLQSVAAGQSGRVRCAFQANVPPGSYTVGLHVRDRDAALYAAEINRAVELEITGSPAQTGLAHLDPLVEVMSDRPHRKPDQRPLVALSARSRSES